MTQLPSNPYHPNDAPSNETIEILLRSLQQNLGNWLEWGKACQQLHKAGYNPQTIFKALSLTE